MDYDTARIFIKGKGKIAVLPEKVISLAELLDYRTTSEGLERIMHAPFLQIKKQIGRCKVIAGIDILTFIQRECPGVVVYPLGDLDVIVEVINDQQRRGNQVLLLTLVCLLLFIGSALTIISFHNDVNMAETHRKLYFFLTGKDNMQSLILPVSYSLGIGAGMLLFFNHIGKKLGGSEPSPLEIEMHLYEKNINQYLRDRQEQAQVLPEAVEAVPDWD
ncbi:MAG: stage V sporulation protein AA [bacterium]|jgi:stage V sporulation protein AA